MASPAVERAPGEPGELGQRQVRLVFLGLMLAMLLAAVDQTVVAAALPTITGDLRELSHLSWVVTAYLLAVTVVMPVFGKAGDLLGRKPVFLFAISVFLAGSMACGLAQSMGQLVVFRAVQGVGGGGIVICAQAIIGDVVSPRGRGRYQGLMGAVLVLASVAGPPIGGLIVDQLSWRWIFYINLPLGAVALTFIATALRLPPAGRRPVIDYLGAVLLGGASVCLVLLTTWGGTRYAWSSPPALALAAATAGLALAWLRGARRAKEPIIPLRLFRDPVFAVACAVSFIIGAALTGGISFLPTYLQVVIGATATHSGLLMLPMMLGLVVATVGSGLFISRTGRYKAFPVAGTGLACVGLLLLATMDASTSRAAATAYMALLGVSVGMIMQVMVLAVQNTVEQRDLGAATSSVNYFRAIGSSTGAAVVGALFASRLADSLSPAAAAVVGTTANAITPAALADLAPAVRQDVVAAFAAALPPVYGYLAPVLLIAFLLTLLLKEKPLRRKPHIGPIGAPAGAADGAAQAGGGVGGRRAAKLAARRAAERAGYSLENIRDLPPEVREQIRAEARRAMAAGGDGAADDPAAPAATGRGPEQTRQKRRFQ